MCNVEWLYVCKVHCMYVRIEECMQILMYVECRIVCMYVFRIGSYMYV